MNIVIPLGNGSRWQDNELRFCLRSVEENLTNYDQIYIIGECPKWVKNVINIPYKEKQKGNPDLNIMEKTSKAFECMDKMLFMNDDHFLLSSFDAKSFPNYYDITLQDALRIRGVTGYGERIKNTLLSLVEQKQTTFNYDVHYPIIYEREKYLNRVVWKDWTKGGFIIKSLYANHETGIKINDCKSNEIPLQHWKAFSTMPNLSEGVKKWLFKRFPKKSKYEL